MNTLLVLLAVQAVLVGIVLTIDGLSFSVSGIISLIWNHPIFFTVFVVIPQAIRKIYGDDGKREKIEGSVFITGCDSGMGETTAIHLASKGFKVFAGVLFESSINSIKEKAKQTSQSCADRLTPIQVDVTNTDNIQRAVEVVKKSIASDSVGLVGIINCAAIAYIGPAEYLPIPEFRRVMEVNFMGYVSVTQAFLPMLKQTISKPGSRRGKIIFIGTGGGVPAPSPPLLSAYMASKWAVDAFSQSLRLELQLSKKRIDPVVINPGFIKPTGLYEAGKKFIEKLWTITPPEAKKEYGNFVDTFVTFGETQPATHVSEVAKTMERAMVTTNTPLRYYVGYDSAASPIVGVLPTEWREWILKKSIFNL